MVTVLAFGTFDQLDDEHVFFLSHARKLGDRLVVSVARDAHVRALKNKEPVQDEQTRRSAVASRPEVDEAVLSDEQLGSYHVIETVSPDAMAIGWDQEALEKSLADWLDASNRSIPLIRIPRLSPS